MAQRSHQSPLQSLTSSQYGPKSNFQTAVNRIWSPYCCGGRTLTKVSLTCVLWLTCALSPKRTHTLAHFQHYKRALTNIEYLTLNSASWGVDWSQRLHHEISPRVARHETSWLTTYMTDFTPKPYRIEIYHGPCHVWRPRQRAAFLCRDAAQCSMFDIQKFCCARYDNTTIQIRVLHLHHSHVTCTERTSPIVQRTNKMNFP